MIYFYFCTIVWRFIYLFDNYQFLYCAEYNKVGFNLSGFVITCLILLSLNYMFDEVITTKTQK